jgi:hypothetical protein
MPRINLDDWRTGTRWGPTGDITTYPPPLTKKQEIELDLRYLQTQRLALESEMVSLREIRVRQIAKARQMVKESAPVELPRPLKRLAQSVMTECRRRVRHDQRFKEIYAAVKELINVGAPT